MALIVFDMGGTSVKFGVWQNDELSDVSSFKTPKTWSEMKASLKQVADELSEKFTFEGVAISAPGTVDQEDRMIKGISAIPYIHHFDIYTELEELLGLKVAIENDANSVALAEAWLGAAKGLKNVILLVIGTGIGGSILVNGEVHHGKNLYGGEFGYAFLDGYNTFSTLGTAVRMAQRYEERMGLPAGSVSGEEVFRLAEEEQDENALAETKVFYESLAKGIHNLVYTFDPEIILIGGGVSNKPNIVGDINGALDEMYKMFPEGQFPLRAEIATCNFKKDANLIGAVKNYYLNHGE